MKLKTIEDFRVSEKPSGMDWVYIDELRQEAIKHIKSNKIAIEIKGTLTHDQETSVVIKSAQTDWIKHFFGITEEDLEVEDKEHFCKCGANPTTP